MEKIHETKHNLGAKNIRGLISDNRISSTRPYSHLDGTFIVIELLYNECEDTQLVGIANQSTTFCLEPWLQVLAEDNY